MLKINSKGLRTHVGGGWDGWEGRGLSLAVASVALGIGLLNEESHVLADL